MSLLLWHHQLVTVSYHGVHVHQPIPELLILGLKLLQTEDKEIIELNYCILIIQFSFFLVAHIVFPTCYTFCYGLLYYCNITLSCGDERRVHLVTLIKNVAENANWNERETLTDKGRVRQRERETETTVSSSMKGFTSCTLCDVSKLNVRCWRGSEQTSGLLQFRKTVLIFTLFWNTKSNVWLDSFCVIGATSGRSRPQLVRHRRVVTTSRPDAQRFNVPAT